MYASPGSAARRQSSISNMSPNALLQRTPSGGSGRSPSLQGSPSNAASSPTQHASPQEHRRQDPLRGTATRTSSLLAAHNTMADAMDAHVRQRHSIDRQLSSIGDGMRRLQRQFQRDRNGHTGAATGLSAMGGSGALLVEPSLALIARLECDVELLQVESRSLAELKAAKQSQCAQLEDALRAEERGWQNSSERRLLEELSERFADCTSTESTLRVEENKLLEAVNLAESAAREAEARRQKLQQRLDALENQALDQEARNAALRVDVSRAEETLAVRTAEKAEWERKVRGEAGGVPPHAAQNAEKQALEAQRDALAAELRTTEKLSLALRQNELDSLRDPSHAMITSKSRPIDETEALIWDATRPVRNVLSLRDTLLVLKARLLNLYDDLDEIVETVEQVRSDPQFSMYAAFSEQSNQWRQQKLYDAFHDAVLLMQNGSYEVDVGAANALLRQLKLFVVVYDLFENHYDAVVNAIMLSDGKWVEAADMLDAALTCQRVFSETRRSSMKRRSVSNMSTNNLGLARTASMRR